ncbi:MAG: hypothetical protein HY291_11405 [Planctomycetes bacterium]|nr:hypothetical protein [Planctomycetota bacterium]
MPAAEPGAQPPAKKGFGTGCKVALGCFSVVLLIVLVVAVIFVNALSWVTNGRETASAPYTSPTLTDSQQSELGKIRADHKKAYATQADWDVVFTPELFNTFVASEIKKKKADGSFKKGEAEGVDIRFDGQDIVIRTTYEDQEKGGYYNVELRGDPHFENGKFLGRVDSIKLADKEAPWLARKFVDMAIDAARKGELKTEKGPHANENPFEGIKLLRREGDKIHIIILGGKVPQPEDE